MPSPTVLAGAAEVLDRAIARMRAAGMSEASIAVLLGSARSLIMEKTRG